MNLSYSFGGQRSTQLSLEQNQNWVSLRATMEMLSSFPSSGACLHALAPGSFHLQTHILTVLSPLPPTEAFETTRSMQIHYKQPFPNLEDYTQYLNPLCHVVQHGFTEIEMRASSGALILS